MDESLTLSYIRALVPKRAPRGSSPGTWTTPGVSRAGVTVGAEHLRRYRQLCAFPNQAVLPLTYPHMTAFPMGMSLLTRRDFPYPVLGLVHVCNEIVSLRPIAVTETLDYRVWVDEPHVHEKGTAFDVCAEVTDAAGDPVWRSRSSYLRRSRPSAAPGAGGGAAAARTQARATDSPGSSAGSRAGVSAGGSAVTGGTAATATWQLPGDLGRRYAALSGDRNPIHLYPWSARLFGFRRQIAHGMWSAARCLAALDVPETPVVFTVDFRAPVFLPSAVVFSAVPRADDEEERSTEFRVASAASDRIHISGRLAPPGD